MILLSYLGVLPGLQLPNSYCHILKGEHLSFLFCVFAVDNIGLSFLILELQGSQKVPVPSSSCWGPLATLLDGYRGADWVKGG